MLNRPTPTERPDILPAKEDLEIECGCPTKVEINNAVRQQRSGKDAGPDNISKEALKAGVGVKVDILYIFCIFGRSSLYQRSRRRDTL